MQYGIVFEDRFTGSTANHMYGNDTTAIVLAVSNVDWNTSALEILSIPTAHWSGSTMVKCAALSQAYAFRLFVTPMMNTLIMQGLK